MQFYIQYSRLESIEQDIEIKSYAHYSLFPKFFYDRHKNEIEDLIKVAKPIDDFIDVHLSMLSPTNEEMMEIINDFFRENIKYAAVSDTLFWDELRKHVYDDIGCIRPFTNDLLKILKQFANRFFTIYDEVIQTLEKNRSIIKSGNYSIGIKKLSDAYMHESEVSFEISKSHVIARFGHALYHGPMTCRFRTVSECSFSIFDCEINESEVVINQDGTFQYNAIVYCSSRELHEIYIKFYDVDVYELG